MKRVIIIVISVIVLGIIILRLVGNREKVNANKNVSTDLSYVSVDVSPVKRMSLSESLQLVGYLEAYSEINIAAETQGKIISMNAEPGQVKVKGEAIATVDNKLKQLAVQTANVSVSKLKKDLERYENLYKGGTVTEQQLNDVQNSYDNAEIQLEQAQKQLADATIKSPINGIITKKITEKGDYINTGNPIATIIDVTRLKVKLKVSETNVYLLKTGDKAIITTDVYQGVTFEGKISFISPKGDETHNYPVEIEIVNNTKHPLKSGTFVNVTINLPSNTEALYIPRESLQGSINDAKVYVAQDGKAVFRDIVAGSGNNKYIRVISGLKNGEKVITTGQVNLSDGKAIKIINNN